MNRITKIACAIFFLVPLAGATEFSFKVSSGGTATEFFVHANDVSPSHSGILVIVPGYNGSGEHVLDDRWKGFADKHDLVLLAPTFKAKGRENNEGKGYYYPEQGSGKVMEKAIREVGRRYRVRTDKVFFFGFSAGAHFAHRFAIWKPQRVGAFVAYSAGWWSEPTNGLKEVPALIMCGEEDVRHEASFQFFKKGQALGSPWLWRSYKKTGHVLSKSVRDMAEVFLEHYVVLESGKITEQVIYGDIQNFQISTVKEDAGPEVRIVLPSRKVAEVWKEELNIP